jgi:transcriptional regulator with XRE-family HTH domain
MAVGSPPTVRRRQLGRELRRLREESGLHADHLAEHLRCSPSRISRIETARVRITPGTVHEILDVLEVKGPDRDRLVALARQADEPGWWQQFGDALTYEYATYIAMEAEASALRSFEPLLVHGLLQTEDYARAIISKGRGGDPAEVEPRVKARLARQEILGRRDAARLWVLIGEEVLHRQVGGPSVMRAQLSQLVHLGQRENVRLQVLPFTGGELASMTGAFSIMEFPSPDPPVVYIENLAGDTYVESDRGLAHCNRVFAELAADALDVPGSLARIESLAKAFTP